nr:RNA-directed DNA polymerase, eukaryota [Tanacetum cinerariifolium]
ISDYFVMIGGSWLCSGVNIFIISVYAPQEYAEKKMLWDYFVHVISKWDGEVPIGYRPIMLRDSSHDYDPIPFRMYHYWFEIDGFEEMISKAWCECPIVEVDNLEAAQKAKIRWAIEGDENTKFYHGILNKKRNQLGIHGVLKDGMWIDNLVVVKKEFLEHFSTRFQQPRRIRPVINIDFPCTIRDVLNRFGFGAKWCGWIQECLRSSRGSVLVNGSPTEEFQFYKGLKQGDPLSPFLFILVMKSLHLSFRRVEDASMFNGIKINSSMTLSHMFYADDAIFMGQWSKRNVDTLMYMLKCFERASGLSINFSKSKFMGLAISIEKVEEVTRHIGCGIPNTPFSFLGSKVRGCRSRIKSWDDVIKKMVNRLSKWKIKTLSIGGRITLLKAVFGSMPIYHMSIINVPMLVLQRMESIRCHFFNGNDLDSKRSIWVSWNKVLTSKEK